MAVLLLTYTVAAWDTPRRAALGLGVVYLSLVVLVVHRHPRPRHPRRGRQHRRSSPWPGRSGSPCGPAATSLESRVREAEERAEVERQTAARALAEERLRIAQELHDVVAHSMSVIAVQAGVGAHVLDERPEQARAALEAISATSRGTLTEMRRLLGVLRDDDGERSHAPGPGLADLPRARRGRARAPACPSSSPSTGDRRRVPPGVELSAYRVVQEALTNVIKHAGSPAQVDVTVRHRPASIAARGRRRRRVARPGAVQRRDGHGARRHARAGRALGRRRSSAGPAPGGGYRVAAPLPVPGTPDDDPRRGRRRPGPRAQRLHHAAVGGEPDIEVVGEAGNGAEAVDARRQRAPGRGADGRAHAGDGRPRGHAADHRRRRRSATPGS